MPAIKSRHVILFITRRFWSFLFGCIIAFAVLVQIGRQAFPLVNDYRELIADSLGEQLGADIHIEQISAKWQGLRPQIILGQVRLHAKTGEEIFRVKRAHAELSLFDSVAQQGLAWRTIIFEEFSTH